MRGIPQLRRLALLAGLALRHAGAAEPAPDTPDPRATLAAEVRSLGWIAYSAHQDRGDWDLRLCRPDGSDIRPLTDTPATSEIAPQFSRDGTRLLFRRLPRTEIPEGNRHGEQGTLVIARSDGSEPEAIGRPGEFPWASWSPDGTRLACLSLAGVQIVDLASRRTLRTLPRRGLFQQLTWSPDGGSLSGVANAFGTGWSVARMDLDSGSVVAVNRVDCCTPDWFPDSRALVFSWRPPGQSGNGGAGWTQLWRVGSDGTSRQLLYAEDGRHVYGGHSSPDGKYVLFTGNMNEDGDPSHQGAPMGLLRLADAPIIGGPSPEVRQKHPQAKSGPVLTLPNGFEPCWTASELPGRTSTNHPSADAAVAAPAGSALPGGATRPPAKSADSDATPGVTTADPARGRDQLATEVRSLGWIVFSADSPTDGWDLHVMRPDGSDRRALTRTPEFNEAGARFSPDGRQLLFYRIPRKEAVDNNTYGTHELVVADADGGRPVSYGRDYPWASWGPGPGRISCLTPSGIQVVELAQRRVVQRLPRRGIVEQLVASPDGTRYVGTANGLGPFWNIGCLDAASGKIAALSETDRYNCTPDWFPDSRLVAYSRGIIPEVGGFAELWVGDAEGMGGHLLCAEPDRHLYGACPSPDGRHLLFTRSERDLGRVDNSRTRLALIRITDIPLLLRDDARLSQRYPDARQGPFLDLGPGWEPHWTAQPQPGRASP